MPSVAPHPASAGLVRPVIAGISRVNIAGRHGWPPNHITAQHLPPMFPFSLFLFSKLFQSQSSFLVPSPLPFVLSSFNP